MMYSKKAITACVLFLANASSVMAAGRESSAPYISGDSFRAIANYIYDETDRTLKGERVRPKSVIFVKTDYLKEFFEKIHPSIPHKYILISHNSDYGAPDAFADYLDDEKLHAWFGQNPTIMGHEKFIAIPIGLANRMWGHGNIDIFNRVLSINKTIREEYLLGINFRIGTKPDVRKCVYDLFNGKSFCKDICSDDLFTYLVNTKKTKFVLSPRGNGLDCHRTWEILLMGAIPVLVHSEMDELLADLPVLLVDNWTDVTEELLHERYAYIKSHYDEYNVGKIKFEYWRKLIEDTRNAVE